MAEPAAEQDVLRTAVIYVRVSTKEQAERDGDPDGYSIPAQRAACQRKAESLGATVVEEFVDRGESARSADRVELQRMLKSLQDRGVDFVVVHKLDRLARNRSDDVNISAQILASGARLVSVTENIDETPSGHLMHGIMSSIAEFYSRNLANEVIKGTQQKVLAGGTPTRAPIGYLNVRKLTEGFEIRTVETDPERAELIHWAFERYAEGDWSLNALAAELEVRGLIFRATAKHAARPVPATKLHQILRNRYYIGYVTWRGIEYEGKHPKLVSDETFERVQQALELRRTSGERSYKREHYLVGTLRCGRCQRKMLYTVTTGRTKAEYCYFYCSSRVGNKLGCGQRYLPAKLVEDCVVRHWRRESVPDEDLPQLRKVLAVDFDLHELETTRQIEQINQRVHSLKRARLKLAEKAIAGVVPDDIAKEKQQQLAAQLLSAGSLISKLQRLGSLHHRALDAAIDLIESCGESYRDAPPELRRVYNQTWFDWLDVEEHEEGIRIVDSARQDLAEALELAISARLGSPREPTGEVFSDRHRNEAVTVSNDDRLVQATGLSPKRCLLHDEKARVSNVCPLVELRVCSSTTSLTHESRHR